MNDGLELKKHSKYFFIGSFAAILIISLILIWPFLNALIGAIVLTYIFYPVYYFILRYIKSEGVSSFITSLLIILLMISPFIFLGTAILNETTSFFYTVRDINIDQLGLDFINDYFGNDIDVGAFVKDGLSKLSISLVQGASDFILNLPQKILVLFVMFILIFYLLIDGKKLTDRVKEALPLKRKFKEDIAKKFNDTVYATLYGVVLTAIIQGVIGMIGLWIFGVSNIFLWGFIMVILAMIPFVGAAFIWFPAAVIKLAAGDITNGVGLLLYGVLIVSTIDNIIRPKIIGSRAKIHPGLVLLGVLGGLKLFGLMGLIVGPLVLSIMTVFFDIYMSEEYDS